MVSQIPVVLNVLRSQASHVWIPVIRKTWALAWFFTANSSTRDIIWIFVTLGRLRHPVHTWGGGEGRLAGGAILADSSSSSGAGCATNRKLVVILRLRVISCNSREAGIICSPTARIVAGPHREHGAQWGITGDIGREGRRTIKFLSLAKMPRS